MILLLRSGATEAEVAEVVARLERHGLGAHVSQGVERIIVGVIGSRSRASQLGLDAMPQVEAALPVLKPYKLVSREFRPQASVVRVAGAVFGGLEIPIIAGPCSVEGRQAFLEAARQAKEAGAHLLRGGAYKPRTSPYSFQGLEEEGLEILAEARAETGIGFVTEVVDPRHVERVSQVADMLQIGARNMANYQLLREAAASGRPVLLKRHFAATVEEWLMAAEYILADGNWNVILCERGIRTFETATRFTLDLNAVALARQLTHLPIIVDPSHGTGKASLVTSLSLAAVAAGADGLIVEVHPRPTEALSDNAQQITPEELARLVARLREVAAAVGRSVVGLPPLVGVTSDEEGWSAADGRAGSQ